MWQLGHGLSLVQGLVVQLGQRQRKKGVDRLLGFQWHQVEVVLSLGGVVGPIWSGGGALWLLRATWELGNQEGEELCHPRLREPVGVSLQGLIIIP